MASPNSGSPHRVTDPRQAHLLTEPRSKDFFKPFLARERSVKEAADLLGCSLNTMLYRVGVMLDAGLIEVVQTRARAGRTVKVYRSVHEAYFVPFSVTPYATLEERLEVQARPLFAHLISAYAAVLRQNDLYGHEILRGENGAVWTTDRVPGATPGGLPTLFSDMTARLTHAEAGQLAQILHNAFARALQPGEGRAESQSSGPYLLMVALLPTVEDPRS